MQRLCILCAWLLCLLTLQAQLPVPIGLSVTVSSSGTLLAPTNLWTVNAAAISAAIGGGGGGTNGSYLSLSGGTMSGPLNMGAQVLYNLSEPTAANNATTKNYVDTAVSAAPFLRLTGGTLSGALNLGGLVITNLGTPSSATHAANKSYVDTVAAGYLPNAGGTLSGPLSMGSQRITSLGTPTAGSDASTKTYVDTAVGQHNCLLAAVAATSMVHGSIVRTGGRLSPGDGAGAAYRYDATSSSSTNWGSVIEQTGIGGRLFLIPGDVVNVRQFGALGDGATDDTLAIQAAAAYCNTGNYRLYFPTGTYVVSGQIQVKCNVDQDDATLQFTSGYTGIGFLIGESSGSTTILNKIVHVPNIVHLGTYPSRSAGDVGVRITNVYYSHVHTRDVTGWYDGVWVGGCTGGAAYNTIFIGHFEDNLRNLRCAGETANVGWSNSNTYLGGSLRHTAGFGDRPASTDNGVRNLLIANRGNNNVYQGVSFEGSGTPYYWVEIRDSADNQLTGCRFENLGARTMQMLVDASSGQTANRNSIGALLFSSPGITSPVIIVGSSGGTVVAPSFSFGGQFSVTGYSSSGRGLITAQNNQSSGNSIASFYPASADVSTAPTSWTTSITANGTLWKLTGDTTPLLQVNATLGRLEWGPGGSSATDINFYRSSSTTLRTLGILQGDLGLKAGTSGTKFSTLQFSQASLSAGTATVANSLVTASTRIFLTIQSPGGTPGFVYVSTRSVGTSFTILSSSNTDTSNVAWLMIEP